MTHAESADETITEGAPDPDPWDAATIIEVWANELEARP